MIHNNRKKPFRRLQQPEIVVLERRELLSTSALQEFGLDLHRVDVRIAELSKVSTSADSEHADKEQGAIAVLDHRRLSLKAAVRDVQVKQMNASMQRRFAAETRLDHGKGMSPADDIDISDFSPIMYGNPSEFPGAFGATYYSPSEIQTAYGLNTEFNPANLATEGKGVTIAIVDAYYDQNIGTDLANFSAFYGLPQLNGVGNNPTFTVQNMQTNNSLNFINNQFTDGYTIDSAAYYGWDGEQALDVEWAHSIAPLANILLVEAASNSDTDLFNGSGSAEAYAEMQPGVVAISNSYGGSESKTEATLDSSFTTPASHANEAFFFSTGDAGAASTYKAGNRTRSIGGVEYPSSSPNVVAVGGTSLYLSSARGRYGMETAWGRYISTSDQEGSSGGVSAYEPVPSYQQGILSYTNRAVPDISLVADEDTGNSVLDSDFFDPAAGIVPGDAYFFQYGGTSLSTPQIAAMSAIGDAVRIQDGLTPLTTNQLLTKVYNAYDSSSYHTDFHDITSGQTGASVSAGTGYDLATGVGTPIGPQYISLVAKA